MSSPYYDPAFGRRMRVAAAAVGEDRPDMAATLAGSDLPDSDINLVGGFTRGLDDASLVRLARQSGARLELSPEQRSRLDALGENYTDVNDSQDDGERNWLERVFDKGATALANTGSAFANLPGVSQVFTALDWLNNVAKLPFRAISAGIDQSDDDEIREAMTARGYDPSSFVSRVAFFTNQGDSLYHDLDPIREEYGNELVDLAIEQQADPEGFAESSLKRDEKTQALLQSPEFARVADLVDRQHNSPGRDIARVLLPKGAEDTAAFTAISGTIDGAYTLLLDPTLIAGKAAAGVRALDAAGNAIRPASRLDRLTGVTLATRGLDRATGGYFRSGIRDATDQDGIRALLRVDDATGQAVTRVGRGAQQFLDRVKAYDEAGDEAEKAVIFSRLQAENRDLMPLFDEVRGRRVLTPDAQARWQSRLDETDDAVNYFAALADEPGVQGAVEGGLGTARARHLVAGSTVRARGARLGQPFRVDRKQVKPDGTVILHGTRTVEGKSVPVRRKVTADSEFEVTHAPPTPGPAPAPIGGDGVPVITDLPPIDGTVKDVNGVGWLVTQGDPIYDLKDFAEYFASTAGMVRMADGAAAKRELLLPGRVALRQRIAGANAARRQRGAGARNAVVYDHSNPYRLLPHEVEEKYQSELDAIDALRAAGRISDSEAARRGDLIYQEIRGKAGFIRRQRAKFEQRGRRLSSLLPTAQALDLTSADSIEQVRRFSRLYMNKAEADRLTSIYAAGDLGRRRQVASAIVEQTLHAAGLSRSESGLAEIERFRLDQANLDKRAYGLSRTDVIKTEGGDRHVALLPSQLSTRVLLPDFRSLQYLATKNAVGGVLTKAGHMRSLLTSDGADALMGAVKMGWITTAAGGLRNAIDEVAGLVLRGEHLQLARGRAAYSRATAEGRRTERAARLEARNIARVPRALRGLPKTIDDYLLARLVGKLLSYTRGELDDESVKYMRELKGLEERQVLDETVIGTYYGDDLMRANSEAVDIHNAGMLAAPVTHNGEKVKQEFAGYGMVEVDGGVGLDRFSDALGMAFQDLTSPAHVALRAILPGGSGDPITDIVEYMQQPVMRHFLRDAEIFQVTKSGKAAVAPEQKLEAIENYAERLAAHVTMLVAGKGAKVAEADDAIGAAARYEFDITKPEWWKDPLAYQPGPINPKLAEMLLKGDIPDRAWLKENLADEELPSHVIGKRFAPVNPGHKPKELLRGYTSMLAKGYNFLVTKQVRAISRNPMLAAAYDQARRNLKGYEQSLRDAGFADEATQSIVERSALRQAENLVIKSIDNPTLSTQYAMLARNFHAFARAQEDWLRRWGRAIRDDPTLIRRGQLYLQGAESAGMVEKDDQGNLIFTFPGSGAVINSLSRITQIFPGLGGVKFPVVPDLTSRVIFLNPSLDNPAGFSATPIVSIPFDVISSITGSDRSLLGSSMDRVINGELGAGRTWYEKILPSWASRIITGSLQDEDPASQYGSAFTSAWVNLEAAGRFDDLDLSDPSAIARVQSDLKAQIANQMALRTLFGFFLPAAPSIPTNDVKDVKTGEYILKPDYVFEKAGLSSLKDEARKVFATLPYEEALVWWAKNRPGELVYEPSGASSKSRVGDSEAQAPATIAAQKWMQEHPYLLDEYGRKGGIATYFIPQGEGDEAGFSMDAYRAQLETGIREYKTLDEFANDIFIQRGEGLYFDTKDDYDAAITAATAKGDSYEADRLQQEWSAVKEKILATNPLLAAKFAEYATSGVARDRTVAQLNKLLSDPRAVRDIGPQAGGVAELLLAQREYQAARDEVAYQRGWYANSRRDEAKTNFEAIVADVVRRFPGLGDLARGVFRVPD